MVVKNVITWHPNVQHTTLSTLLNARNTNESVVIIYNSIGFTAGAVTPASAGLASHPFLEPLRILH